MYPSTPSFEGVLTAAGGNYGSPPAGFYRRLRDPQTRAEEVAQLFLGRAAAMCPLPQTTPASVGPQDDYYDCFAAFFARLAYRDGPFFLQNL